MEQNCLSYLLLSRDKERGGDPDGSTGKNQQNPHRKMHFFFEILLWACFAFPKCVTLDLENRGRKRVGFYTSDPPTTERSHAGRLLHSSRGKEWGFHFKFCFLLFVGTRFINHRPNCTVHFSYTQSGICKNTNYIHHLIKGSFSFVPCCVVWKAKRNKPWKTKES